MLRCRVSRDGGSSAIRGFVVAQSNFLLQFEVVTLDPPAELGKVDHAFEADVACHRGQPVMIRFSNARWPFDRQPLTSAGSLRLRRVPGGPATGQNREVSGMLLPSRQVIVCQPRGRSRARVLTVTADASRRGATAWRGGLGPDWTQLATVPRRAARPSDRRPSPWAGLTAILPATPTERLPFFGNPVSSMIQAWIGSPLVIDGNTCSRTGSGVPNRTRALATKCSSD